MIYSKITSDKEPASHPARLLQSVNTRYCWTGVGTA